MRKRKDYIEEYNRKHSLKVIELLNEYFNDVDITEDNIYKYVDMEFDDDNFQTFITCADTDKLLITSRLKYNSVANGTDVYYELTTHF